jgi:transcriptional regulator with XRE-family HTH domain
MTRPTSYVLGKPGQLGGVIFSLPNCEVANAQTDHKVDWLSKQFPDLNDQREYAQERCIVALTESLGALIESAGISRAELAKRINRSKGYVSQVLSGSRNMTLRTLADIAWACGQEIGGLQSAPLGIANVPFEVFYEGVAGGQGYATSNRAPATGSDAANNNFALAA